MVKKVNAAYILVLLMIVFSFNFVCANLENVSLEEGIVCVEDIEVFSEMPSTELSGLISSLTLTGQKYLDFLGLKIWKSDLEVENVQDFTLYLVSPTTIPDFSNLTTIELFEATEEIEVRGSDSHIFETYLMSYGILGGDIQTISPNNLWFDVINGNVSSLKLDVGTSSEEIVYRLNGLETPSYVAYGIACDLNNCPTMAEMNGLYPSLTFDRMGYFLMPEFGNRKFIYFKDGINSVGLIYDVDNSGIWNFYDTINYIKSSASWQGQVAVISETGLYDVYVVI